MSNTTPGGLAVPLPVLPPSDTEAQAIRQLFARNGWELDSVRQGLESEPLIAEIKTAPMKTEAKPDLVLESVDSSTLLDRAKDAERARIQREIDELRALEVINRIQPKPESTE